MNKKENTSAKKKIIYWIFRVEAILIFLFWGINFAIPLGIIRTASAIWIIYGALLIYLAESIKNNKNWAPVTSLVLTTIPFPLFFIIMDYINEKIMTIYEGPATGVPGIIWMIFILNLALSMFIILEKRKS